MYRAIHKGSYIAFYKTIIKQRPVGWIGQKVLLEKDRQANQVMNCILLEEAEETKIVKECHTLLEMFKLHPFMKSAKRGGEMFRWTHAAVG